jgi:PEP-CTERM motif
MHFDLATDSQGNISSWEVEVSTSEFPPENFLEMSTIAARFGIEDGTCKGLPCSMDLALVDDNPGTWTSTSNVPEPSSLLQLGLGFMGILGLYLRSRRSLKPTEQL